MEDLTALQAAEILHMSDGHVRAEARRGILKGYKLANTWFFRRQDVRLYAELQNGGPIEGFPIQADETEHRLRSDSVGVDLGQAHQRKLEFFSQRLRDRLFIAHVCDLFSQHGRLNGWYPAYDMYMPWLGEEQRNVLQYPTAEEREVADTWGQDCRDQLGNQLFPLFKSHLANHSCWATLPKLGEAYNLYFYRSRELYSRIKVWLEKFVREDIYEDWPDLEAMIIDSMLRHLIWKPTMYQNQTRRPYSGLIGGIPQPKENEKQLLYENLALAYPDYWWGDSSWIWTRHLRPDISTNCQAIWWTGMRQAKLPTVMWLTEWLIRRIPWNLMRVNPWTRSVKSLARLLDIWKRGLGSDQTLRVYIMQGTCPECPQT